tara:strand:- start:289 stop:492 length:204 start_codon:yes stop_codon:yes gene_type:complete
LCGANRDLDPTPARCANLRGELVAGPVKEHEVVSDAEAQNLCVARRAFRKRDIGAGAERRVDEEAWT